MCQMICLHVSLESQLYACDAKHSRLWRDSLTCVTWLFQMSFIRVTWLVLTCHMTYSDVHRDPCRCVTYLAKQSNPFPHFRCAHFETWLIYICAWCSTGFLCVHMCIESAQHVANAPHIAWQRPVLWLILSFRSLFVNEHYISFFAGNDSFDKRQIAIEESFTLQPLHVGVGDAVFFMRGSYRTHKQDMFVTWNIHVRDITHSYVSNDSFTCVRWFAYMCHSSLSYMRVMPNTHVCDMTPWHVWHDCFRCHSYVWHESYLRVIWLIQMFAVTRTDVWHIWQSSLIRSHTFGVRTLRHDSFTCVTWHVHVLNRIFVCTYVHWIANAATYRLTKIHRMAHFWGLCPQISIIQSLVAGEKSPNVKSSFVKRHVWI